MNDTPHDLTCLPWRRRLIWLRGLLVVVVLLGLSGLQQLGHGGYQLSELLWLAGLLLPNLVGLISRSPTKPRQQTWMTMELFLDVVFFTGLLHGFGGAGNPLSFYLLVPALLAALTLPSVNALLITMAVLGGYLLSLSWYQMPAMNSPLHALSHELSSLHSLGMATIFVAMLMLLSVLGQTIQRLSKNQQRQQEQALSLAGRRERMYQVAASWADQAHELNTPLATLVMLADNLLQRTSLSQPARDELRQMASLAHQVADHLKSPPQQQLPANATLSDLVAQLRDHLRHLAPTLTIKGPVANGPPLANVDAWFRVLCNLGYNALDAGATTLAIELQADARQWLLQISDDGPMHQRLQRQGLGIGMALIHTSLEQLNARYQVDFARRWTQVRIQWSQDRD